MAQIGRRTFIEILLDHLMSYHGFGKFIFCTGYEAGLVEHHVRRIMEVSEPSMDVEFYFSREEWPMGTGGCLIPAAKFIGDRPFFVFNGDTIHRFDPMEMFRELGEDGNGVACISGDWEYCGSFLFSRRFLDILRKMTAPFQLEDAIDRIGGVVKIKSEQPFFDIGTPDRLRLFRGSYGDR